MINKDEETVSPEIKAMIEEEDRWEEDDRILANLENDPAAAFEKIVEILSASGRF